MPDADGRLGSAEGRAGRHPGPRVRTAAPGAGTERPARLSFVLGGPLYRLYVRSGLTRPPLERLPRRLLLIPAIAWLPLLVLSAIEGSAVPGITRVPFAYDLQAHARFLVALPLLIAAEPFVDRWTGPVAGHFLSRRIVPPAAVTRFDAIVASATRLCSSVALEVLLILLVYTLGHYLWTRQEALRIGGWWTTPGSSGLRLSWAGWWYAYVSIPIFQFILLRWYFRVFVWSRFLWQVSRLSLRLVPTHPDRAGGLGFLTTGVVGFAPVLLAQGALLAGLVANRMLHEGIPLLASRKEIAAVVTLPAALILAPLIFFTSHLLKARRSGMLEYGTFASEYVLEFDTKWIRTGPREEASPLGSADIQSLADLANSFEGVRRMRLVPFGVDAVVLLVAATALPVTPLLLTVVPLEQLATKLLEVLL